MEEKYTFKEKQKVIYHMIKKKLYKEHISHIYQNLDIKSQSEYCFNCYQNINNNGIYCSKICQNIFESNINKNNLYINCIPFSLLNLKSRNKIINIINKNIIYDKVNIYYKYSTLPLKLNTFKKILLTISFIHNYKKILIEELELETNIFKSKIDNNKTFIKSLTIPKKIDKELPNNCLYCNNEISISHYSHLTNNYVLGRFCSKFCNVIYLSIYEQHTRQPYKYFLNLPTIQMLNDTSIIEKFKKEQDNIYNTSIYNTVYNNNKINIIELIY